MRKRAILVAGALVGAILVGLSGIKDIEDNRTKNSRTNTLIQEGLAKIEDNKLEEAIQIFDRVLEVDHLYKFKIIRIKKIGLAF